MLTIDRYEYMTAKGYKYVGLGDVEGGKLWFCVANRYTNEMVWFERKKGCEKHIRQNFGGRLRNAMLNDLRNTKGRAWIYA